MGNWHISIKGTGVHHNRTEKDADVLASRFVEALRAAGHTVHNADITAGGSYALPYDAESIFLPNDF
jgi:hypothetical protein